MLEGPLGDVINTGVANVSYKTAGVPLGGNLVDGAGGDLSRVVIFDIGASSVRAGFAEV